MITKHRYILERYFNDGIPFLKFEHQNLLTLSIGEDE